MRYYLEQIPEPRGFMLGGYASFFIAQHPRGRYRTTGRVKTIFGEFGRLRSFGLLPKALSTSPGFQRYSFEGHTFTCRISVYVHLHWTVNDYINEQKWASLSLLIWSKRAQCDGEWLQKGNWVFKLASSISLLLVWVSNIPCHPCRSRNRQVEKKSVSKKVVVVVVVVVPLVCVRSRCAV